MSIKHNSIANYFGQSYMLLIGVIITPLYMEYLGAEAYGLVGFFALMQAWLALLDLGLSPTLGRQVAFARGLENGFDFFRRLLKSFEVIFLVLAIVIILTIVISSEWLGRSWIKAELLDNGIIAYCISLMGVMIGFRWFSGLYRSGINGLEDQVWLNIANAFLVSLKFIGALVLLAYFSQDVRHFFEYQLIIGILELIVFGHRFYKKLPNTQNPPPIVYFDFAAVKRVAPFALSIAYTAGIWVLITQSDKIILSGILPLAEFGYFSLIALVAGSITMLSGPINQAILPRMTMLIAQGQHYEMLNIYRQGSQIVTFICFAVALIIGFFAEPLLYAWTGDITAATWGAEILIWFSLGNGFLAISGLQYTLQSAFGKLKLHVIGSTISVLIQVPLIFYAAINYGAVGAGIAWFAFRLLWFIFWMPIIHRQFVPGFHLKWLYKEILPILSFLIFSTFLLSFNINLSLSQNRFSIFLQIVLTGILLLAMSAISSSVLRRKMFQIINITRGY